MTVLTKLLLMFVAVFLLLPGTVMAECHFECNPGCGQPDGMGTEIPCDCQLVGCNPPPPPPPCWPTGCALLAMHLPPVTVKEARTTCKNASAKVRVGTGTTATATPTPTPTVTAKSVAKSADTGNTATSGATVLRISVPPLMPTLTRTPTPTLTPGLTRTFLEPRVTAKGFGLGVFGS